jgi:hypothetical protein
MTTLAPPPPPIPRTGIYDFVRGVSFYLAPDGSLTLNLPEPDYESITIELTPDQLAAIFAFADRVDLRRLLGRLGVAPPIHD